MFIDDNKALMRRMYGSFIQPSIDLPETPKTPASTTFIRSFPSLRFKRSVLEGYIEDFLLDEDQSDLSSLEQEPENYWSALLKNSSIFEEFNKTASASEWEIFENLRNAHHNLDRPKRQAGFPGVKPSNDNK